MSAISVQGVQFDVPGKRILEDVDLEVEKGEFVAIMGMSGSGKTTLLKCISGLVRPSGGSIFVEGEDIVPLSERDMDRVRLRMGMVFQYAALFDSLSVYDNVAFSLRHHSKLSRDEIDDVVAKRLEEVGMADTGPLFPSELSGGMQKRVGLARALAYEPAVLLYDEPTSGLDPVIARTIDELMIETRDRRGVTSIVVSHDIRSIFRIADKIAMVDGGTIVAFGTPDELRSSSHPRVRDFLSS